MAFKRTDEFQNETAKANVTVAAVAVEGVGLTLEASAHGSSGAGHIITANAFKPPYRTESTFLQSKITLTKRSSISLLHRAVAFIHLQKQQQTKVSRTRAFEVTATACNQGDGRNETLVKDFGRSTVVGS